MFWGAVDFPLDAFSDIDNLQVIFHVEVDECGETHNTKELSDRWGRLLERSQSLKSLKIDSDQYYFSRPRWTHGHPFPHDSLAIRPYEGLTHLVWGFIQCSDEALFRGMFANLSALTSVVVKDCTDDATKAFWSALSTSPIRLSSIDVEVIPLALKHYLLRTDVPLQSFRLCHRWDPLEDISDIIFTSLLEIHSATIQALDVSTILHTQYYVNNGPTFKKVGQKANHWDDTRILECAQLRSLALVFDLREWNDHSDRPISQEPIKVQAIIVSPPSGIMSCVQGFDVYPLSVEVLSGAQPSQESEESPNT